VNSDSALFFVGLVGRTIGESPSTVMACSRIGPVNALGAARRWAPGSFAMEPLALPRAAESRWSTILAEPSTPRPTFEPSQVEGLPEVAQRWLLRAVSVGSPLWEAVELEMTGEIRLKGAWRPFSARQALAPSKGFFWAAQATVGRFSIRGFDSYLQNEGEMRWKLLGVISVMSARGQDVTGSARGRLAGESVLVPTSFSAGTWRTGPFRNTVVVERLIDGHAETVQLGIGRDGTLTDVSMSRWGDPEGKGFGRYPFGVSVTEERTFHGVTIPAVLEAGWWHGTERQQEGRFFRAHISSATFH